METPGGTTGGGGAPPRGCGRGGCCTGGMPGADPTGFIGICAGGAPCGAPGASGIVGGPPGGIGAGCAGAASAGLASPVGGGCSSGLTASSSLTSVDILKVVLQNGAAEGGREAIDCSFCASPRSLSREDQLLLSRRTSFASQPIPPWDTCHAVVRSAISWPALVWCGRESRVAAAAAESVLCKRPSHGERRVIASATPFAAPSASASSRCSLSLSLHAARSVAPHTQGEGGEEEGAVSAELCIRCSTAVRELCAVR